MSEPTLHTYNTILLIGDLNNRPEEARAGGTIKPGMLLGQTTTAHTQPGERPRVVAHATAGGPSQGMVAKENTYKGGTMSVDGLTIGGGTIDDNYTIGQTVFIHICQPGDVIYAVVAASATAFTEADYLTSDGAGGLKKATSTDIREFQPLEAVNNSGSTAATRVRARKL